MAYQNTFKVKRAYYKLAEQEKNGLEDALLKTTKTTKELSEDFGVFEDDIQILKVRMGLLPKESLPITLQHKLERSVHRNSASSAVSVSAVTPIVPEVKVTEKKRKTRRREPEPK